MTEPTARPVEASLRPVEPTARRPWVPRQHGAWAMLAIPLLVGVAASRPDPWQVVLAATSVAGYLASSVALDWLRARQGRQGRQGARGRQHRGGDRHLVPMAVYGTLFAVTGIALVAAHPGLVTILPVIVPAGAVAVNQSARGHPRSLVASLAQASQALMLVPAAALVAGPVDWPTVLRATFVAGLFLVGTVLVVRSLIRERGNTAFVSLSVGFHVVAVAIEAVVLPTAWIGLGVLLTLRAAGLPILQRGLAGGPWRLRPIHVGLVELAASSLVVAVAFLAGF